MKKVMATIVLVVLGITFILVYNSEKVDKLYELESFEKRLEYNYQIMLPDELSNKNQNDVYIAIKKALEETNGNIYFDKMDGNKKVKYIYITDNSCFNNITISEGRLIDKYDMETEEYMSTSNIYDENKVGKLSSFAGDNEFEIRPLKQIIDSEEVMSGYASLSFQNSDEIHVFLDKVKKDLGTETIEILENTVYKNIISSEIGIFLVIAAIYLIIVLMVLYSLVKSYKKIAVQKLMGMSNKDIFIKLSKSIIITYLVLCIVVIGGLSTVLFKELNSLYFEFLLKIVSIYTVELIIFISAIAIPFQYVRRIKIGNMIKNKKPTKEILYLNFITKVIYLMVFTIIINLCINQYKETETLYTETLKQWEDVEDYYCVPYLYNTPDDLRERSDFWTNLKNIYLEFNSEGGILANFKEYTSNDSDDISGDFDGPMAVINPNYLKKYSVYDMNNNKIEVDESEEEYLVIIPEKYKDKENKIIDYIKFQNNGVNDEKYANKPIKIIWMKNNQSVFSFSMGINLEDNNSIVDPIMIVLTNNNGTGYMYDCVLGISGSPFKIKIPEGEDPKAYIKDKVDKHSYSKYINKISKANGTMLGKTDNIKDVIKYLAITILTLGSIIILIIFQGVYNFFEQSKEKIIIRKLHGYRWIDKYREYLILLLFSWFIIISSLLFSNLIPAKRVIIISISCIIVELVFTGIAFYIISNKRIVQVIKGAE